MVHSHAAVQICAWWRHASLGLCRLPPELNKTIRRNMLTYATCGAASGYGLVTSHGAPGRALNAALLAGVGYYFVRMARLLLWHGRNQAMFDEIHDNIRRSRGEQPRHKTICRAHGP